MLESLHSDLVCFARPEVEELIKRPRAYLVKAVETALGQTDLIAAAEKYYNYTRSLPPSYWLTMLKIDSDGEDIVRLKRHRKALATLWRKHLATIMAESQEEADEETRVYVGEEEETPPKPEPKKRGRPPKNNT